MCNLTQSTLVIWDRSNVNLERNQLTSLRTISRNLKLGESVKDWPLGLHYIRLSVSMRGKEGTENFDFGFVNVTLPPLVALIDGPSSYMKAIGPFTLDGSKSYDPSDTAQGFTYIWLCRRLNETFDNINMSDPIDVATSGKRDRGGCFGNGPGRMNSTEAVLHVRTPYMEAKQMYVFQLIVRSHWRVSKINHTVLVNSSLTYRIQ